MALEMAKQFFADGKKEDEVKQLLLDAKFSEEKVNNTLALPATPEVASGSDKTIDISGPSLYEKKEDIDKQVLRKINLTDIDKFLTPEMKKEIDDSEDSTALLTTLENDAKIILAKIGYINKKTGSGYSTTKMNDLNVMIKYKGTDKKSSFLLTSRLASSIASVARSSALRSRSRSNTAFSQRGQERDNELDSQLKAQREESAGSRYYLHQRYEDCLGLMACF